MIKFMVVYHLIIANRYRQYCSSLGCNPQKVFNERETEGKTTNPPYPPLQNVVEIFLSIQESRKRKKRESRYA